MMRKKRTNNLPRALYIHIPFCLNICSYCSFCHLLYDENRAIAYIDRLIEELKQLKIGELHTIYIGGGTPSSLPIFVIEKLFKEIDKIHLDDDYEFSIEANVESLDEEKLKFYLKHRINRLSIGVESFDANILKDMRRNHDAKMVEDVIKLAKSLGFNNINCDLIYGYPHETINILKNDLNCLVALDINHISCYGLTVEDRSILHAKKIKPQDDDMLRDEYDIIYKFLNKHGYKRYETSNFAKPTYESKHNLTYWYDEQYYGIGLSAASYIDGLRLVNTSNFERYLHSENIIEEKEYLTEEDHLFYEFMLRLRLDEGLSLDNIFNEVNFETKNKYLRIVNKYLDRNLLTLKDNRLKTTYEGSLLLDSILIELL